MFKIFGKIIKVGVLSEPAPQLQDAELENLGGQVHKLIERHFSGSLAIRQVDAGSCNACELEIHALNNVFYNIERFGVHFVASPRHADVLLVTGPVSRHMEAALLRTYAAMPAPKFVIAVGECAINGGEFGKSYASCGGLHHVLAVDLSIPGCPPTPTALLRGILQLMQRAKETPDNAPEIRKPQSSPAAVGKRRE